MYMSSGMIYASGDYLVHFAQRIHPHDEGLPLRTVRARRGHRRVAFWMMLVALLTAVPGWIFFGASLRDAILVRSEDVTVTMIAWAVLAISGITFVLGVWYLLLAHVKRIARMVDSETPETDQDNPADAANRTCPNCGWPHDAPDRFCRHCGKALLKLEV